MNVVAVSSREKRKMMLMVVAFMVSHYSRRTGPLQSAQPPLYHLSPYNNNITGIKC